MGEKILLDTDIGSDIDDALALGYLLARDDCELLGITTVTAPTLERAKLASAMCVAAGRDVPICPGCDHTLLGGPWTTVAPQAAALGKWKHQTQFESGRAIGFMREVIRANPGEVTLLGIGPMTNLGLLFTLDPDLAGLLKGLVLMCGKFLPTTAGYGPREMNALADPYCTAAVYRQAVGVHRSVGLDVTMQVIRPVGWVKQRCVGPIMAPVRDFLDEFGRGHGEVMFHDPLAGVMVFEPGLCAWSRGRVEVELTGGPRSIGMTHWTGQKDCQTGVARHEVAVGVDVEGFFERYFSVFSQ